MADSQLQDDRVFAFGTFTLDPGQRLLFRGSDVVALEPKVFDTLLALVESAGRALTKDELLSRVWPDVTVEEGSLTRNVSTLRKVLATDDNPDGFIETLPRRGYRFRPVVRRVPAFAAAEVPASEAGEPASGSVTQPRRTWRAIAVGIVVGLMAVALGAAWRWNTAGPAPIKAIAVLPLQNLSGDAGQEFFADGMTEAVITKLAQLTDARVTSRTSVMRYKATSESVPAIGRQLDVDAVVEGSVQRAGDRVSVTVQLIHAASDTHLWAKDFEGTTADVFGLQRRIAMAIASDIASKIAPKGLAHVAERSVSAEAYDAYLRGRFFFWKTDLESLQRAVAEFRHAIALAPAFADAHASLSLSLGALEMLGVVESSGEPMEAARKAVALDDTLADAHAALAGAEFGNWDWEGSERDYERALSLYTDSLDACYRYPMLLSAIGRHDEAVIWAARFSARNPVSPGLHSFRARVLINARRYAEAERHLKLALELEPDGSWTPIELADLYTLTDRREDAIALLSASPSFATSAFLASAYAASGRREDALAIVKVIEPNPRPRDVVPLALVYFRLGDDDRGFQWLERAVRGRLSSVRFLNVDPAFDRWRADPRFTALIRELRLPSTSG